MSAYACKDREIKPTIQVQDGWIEVDVLLPSWQVGAVSVPLIKQIANAFAGKPPCGHDLRQTDARCNGCSLR